jgi:hypothetical protein
MASLLDRPFEEHLNYVPELRQNARLERPDKAPVTAETDEIGGHAFEK